MRAIVCALTLTGFAFASVLPAMAQDTGGDKGSKSDSGKKATKTKKEVVQISSVHAPPLNVTAPTAPGRPSKGGGKRKKKADPIDVYSAPQSAPSSQP